MKLAIDCGHNCPPDTGAVGVKEECKLTRELGNLLIPTFNVVGVKAIDVTPKKATSVRNSLNQRVLAANELNADYYISLHFNAFNKRAYGTEIFAISNAGKNIAHPILKEICKLGFFNRGVKNGNHLWVLKNTAMPAILIECCFIDSEKDMSLYNAQKMCDAIVRTLI